MTSSSSSSPEISAATTSTSTTQPESHPRFSYKYATHDEVMEDLSSRFILNLPDEELASLERICFQVEQAHWFYEDFIREENPKFPSYPLKKFSALLFHACPLLHEWSHDHELAFNRFMQYKTRVPVCGAIMLNDTWEKCVLVKGWKSSSGWGFPKGKINEDEPEPSCAIREVLEETGYNLAGKLNPEDVIEMSIKEQKISLYVVPNVPEDYPFKTKTRKEISKIEWFRLTDLPTWKRNKQTPGKFYLISPFIGALKQFVHDRKPRNLNKRNQKNAPRPNSTHEEMLTPSSDIIYSDGHAQESSSQSSSADNGEPHTPSPQYSEPTLNIVNGPRSTSSKKDSEVIDPHFARLLSSLTLSATKGSQVEEKSVLPVLMEEAPLVEPSTPVMTSTAPGQNDILTKHLAIESNRSPVIPLAPHYQYPQSSHPRSASDEHYSRPTNPGTSPNPPPTATVSPRRGLTSRRSSSTTDISPYVSRPIEMSGRRLKQLALLELVVDESAKMTPQAGKKELPFVEHTNELPASQVGAARPHFAPAPSASVPPPSDPSDPRLIYSSGLGGPMGGSPNFLPISAAPYPIPFHPSDPFQIRSHTSHSFHRANAFHPNGNTNQSQLLAMFNGPRTPVHPAPGMFPPHGLPNGLYHPSNIVSGLPPWATPRAVQAPVHGTFHGLQPTMRSFPPSPAAANFAPPQPQGNGQLLSILNSGLGGPPPGVAR